MRSSHSRRGWTCVTAGIVVGARSKLYQCPEALPFPSLQSKKCSVENAVLRDESPPRDYRTIAGECLYYHSSRVRTGNAVATSEQPHQRRRRGSGTSHAPHSLGPSEVQVSRDERKRVGCGLRSATAQPRARSTEKTRGRHAPTSRRAVFLQGARVDFLGGARLIAKIVQSSPLD